MASSDIASHIEGSLTGHNRVLKGAGFDGEAMKSYSRDYRTGVECEKLRRSIKKYPYPALPD